MSLDFKSTINKTLLHPNYFVMNRIIVALLCFTTSILAQTVQVKSLDEALKLAKSQGLRVKQLEIQQEVARYDQRIASSGLLPTLSASGTSDYNVKLPVQLIPAEIFGGPAGTFNQVRFGQPWNSSATGVLEVPIFHPDKYAQMKVAQANRNKTEADADAQINSYLQSVTQVYLSVLVLRDALSINAELDSTARLLYITTKARHGQQLLGQVDLNRAENLMLSTYQQTNNVKANVSVAERQLAALLGLNPSQTIDITDQLKNYDNSLKSKIELQSQERSSVKSAQLAKNAAGWNLKQQSYASLPKISFNSRYTYANQSQTLFSGSGTNFDYGTVGMSVSLPIFKGFNLTNQRKKAKLQLNIADLQLQQAFIDSDQEIKDWNARLNEKQQSGAFASRRDEMASTTLNLSIMNYNEGVISLDQLFNIYNEYAQAKNSFLQTKADIIMYEQWLKIEQE
jgi:outer membrane protein